MIKGIHKNYPLKQCVICAGQYKPTSGKQYACSNCSKTYWRLKHSEQARIRGRKRKQMAIEYLGDACQSCKRKYHPSQYEFHHVDPKEKDHDPSKALQMTWEKFKNELDKCQLLCANCHRLEHHKYESNWGSDWVDDGV